LQYPLQARFIAMAASEQSTALEAMAVSAKKNDLPGFEMIEAAGDSSAHQAAVVLKAALDRDVDHQQMLGKQLADAFDFSHAMMNALPAYGTLTEESDLHRHVNGFRQEIQEFRSMMFDFMGEVMELNKKYNVVVRMGEQVLQDAAFSIKEAETSGIPVDMQVALESLTVIKEKCSFLVKEREILEGNYKQIRLKKKLKAALELENMLAGGEGTKSSIFQVMEDQLKTKTDFAMQKLAAEGDHKMAEENLKVFNEMKQNLEGSIQQIETVMKGIKSQVREIVTAPAAAMGAKVQQFKEYMSKVQDTEEEYRKAIQETCDKERERLKQFEAEQLEDALKIDGGQTEVKKTKNHFVIMIEFEESAFRVLDNCLLHQLKVKREGKADDEDMVSLIYFKGKKVYHKPTMSWNDFETKYAECKTSHKSEADQAHWNKAWALAVDVVHRVHNGAKGNEENLHWNTVVLACVTNPTDFSWSGCSSTMKELFIQGGNDVSGSRTTAVSTTVLWMLKEEPNDAMETRVENWTKAANGKQTVWNAPDGSLRQLMQHGSTDSVIETVADTVHLIASVGPISLKDKRVQQMESREQALRKMQELAADRCETKMNAIAAINNKCNQIMEKHMHANPTLDQNQKLKEFIEENIASGNAAIKMLTAEQDRFKVQQTQCNEKIQQAKNIQELSKLNMEAAAQGLEGAKKQVLTDEDWTVYNERVANNQKRLQGIDAKATYAMLHHFIMMRNGVIQNCAQIFLSMDMILTPIMTKIISLEKTASRKLDELGLQIRVLRHLNIAHNMELDFSQTMFDLWRDIIMKMTKDSCLDWGEGNKKIVDFAKVLPMESFLYDINQLKDAEDRAQHRTKKLKKVLTKELSVKFGSENATILSLNEKEERLEKEQSEMLQEREELKETLKREGNDGRQEKLERKLEKLQNKIETNQNNMEVVKTKQGQAEEKLKESIEKTEKSLFEAIPILVTTFREACSACILKCTGELWKQQVGQLVAVAGGDGLKVMTNLNQLTTTVQSAVENEGFCTRRSLPALMSESVKNWFPQGVKRPLALCETQAVSGDVEQTSPFSKKPRV